MLNKRIIIDQVGLELTSYEGGKKAAEIAINPTVIINALQLNT
jgi:hypothetical protein